jgi:hypothetical protein
VYAFLIYELRTPFSALAEFLVSFVAVVTTTQEVGLDEWFQLPTDYQDKIGVSESIDDVVTFVVERL